jgi:hypothetical protein
MTATYEKIATQTLGSNTASITFSSISGSYTDLIAICEVKGNDSNFRLRINSDSGSNYSATAIYGAGSSVGSTRVSNQTYLKPNGSVYMGNMSGFPNNRMIATWQFMNYSNTTTYKTILRRADNAVIGGTDASVGLWRSNSAITAIEFSGDNGDLYAGSNITLYGIKAE